MTEPVSLQSKLGELFQQRQFYWWLGHVCVVCNGLIYFSSVLSLNSNVSYYKRAFLGALLSYAVVIYNSIGVTHTRISMDLLCDENVHYFVIAFYWYSYQPITVTLIPFFIFSIFHTLTYTKSTLLPFLSIPKSELDSKIQYFTDTYHTTAMQYVAYIEVVIILGRLILGIILFRTSVLALIVFVHFLRLRYFLSSYTRDALKYTTLQLDQWFIVPSTETTEKSTLTVISNIYVSIKRLVSRYGGDLPVDKQ
ncbi:hypothetical protein BD770DRAFT_385038 [Pilaira anomala]|nr:hypothetical protein BD770DRAFT_385038 [Pilaira anomala]